MATAGTSGGGSVGRLLPLSGAAFVVAAVAAIAGIGGDTPENDATAASVMSFYDAHDNRQFVAAFVLAAAVPLLVIFGVYLACALWPSEPGRRPVWQVVLAGGSLVAGGAFALAAFVHVALADGADSLTPGALQALNVLDSNVWVAFNVGLGVMMLGAAGSLLPGRRAFGWTALVLGIALFIPIADFFALLLTALWILVLSVVQSRRGVATP